MAAEADTFFETAHLARDLRRLSARGSVVLVAAQSGKLVLQLAAMVVLARLLTPTDFGLFAVVLAFTAFVSLFEGLGLTLSTVQSPTVDHRQASALFWIGTGVGAVLALATAAASPLLGLIYGDRRVVWMTLALAATFALGGLASQHQAVLRRQLRFGRVAAIELAALAVGVAAGIAAAVGGAGYWSLVAVQLATEVAAVCGAWLACAWRPARPGRGVGVRGLLVFGGEMTSFNLLGYFTHVFDNLLVGAYSGARQVGFYDRGFQIVLVPITHVTTPLANVAHATLSRLQADAPRYRRYLTKYILVSTGVGMPLVAFLFVSAGDTIPLVLGAQWHPVIALTRAIAPAAFLMTLTSATGWMFVSLGRTRRQLRWSIFTTAVTVIAFLAGLHWGPLGVALAFSSWRAVSALPTIVYCCRGSSVRWREFVAPAVRPAAASLAAAAALGLLLPLLPGAAATAARVVCEAAVYGALLLAAWLAVPGGRRTLRENAGLVTSSWRPSPEPYGG